jgi:DNA-3-methyladenine glycosylase II
MTKRILAHLSSVDINMGALIKAHGPYRLRVESNCEPFQTLARAITHQQLHGAAAAAIFKRFVGTCGDGSWPSAPLVMKAPIATLRAAGLSFAKIACVKDLAAKTLAGVVPDRRTLEGLTDTEIIERLTQVRGIGRWTVQMLLIFQLRRPDVLPVDDFGVRNGFRLAYGMRKMPAPRALDSFGERWAPHRTAAAWYLWRATELHRAGKLPPPSERVRLPRVRTRRRRPARK